MSLEQVVVEEFDIYKDGDNYSVAFELKDEPIEDAEFMYDGRNCAVLVRNKKKAFLLTNIIPEMRRVFSKLGKIGIYEKDGEKVVCAYDVDIRHVKDMPYPDNFQKDMKKMMDELKEELGKEDFDKLMEISREVSKEMESKK
ncbi:MAG: hypothetical protein J6T72_04940 [Alphaproteobacteria bacterium]|nr:hypothetical protein [Alphaproteobacteria bacterium]